MIENIKELVKQLLVLKADEKFLEGATSLDQPLSFSNAYKIEGVGIDRLHELSDIVLEIEESGHLVFTDDYLLDMNARTFLKKNGFDLSASGSSAMIHLTDTVWIRLVP